MRVKDKDCKRCPDVCGEISCRQESNPKVCQLPLNHSGDHVWDEPSPKGLETATELEWLRFFKMNADFGPADSDVQDMIRARFVKETGKKLPDGWDYGSDGEQLSDDYYDRIINDD